MNIVTENEIGKPGSNSELVCCIHFCINALGKGMDPLITIPSAMGLITG